MQKGYAMIDNYTHVCANALQRLHMHTQRLLPQALLELLLLLLHIVFCLHCIGWLHVWLYEAKLLMLTKSPLHYDENSVLAACVKNC